ncbi:MAG: glycosyltransferase family 4 protein [Candidatus Omnitrophota bacterium]
MKSTKKTKTRILRIIARLNIGGPAIHTILLSEGINPDFFESCLVTGKPDRSEGDMSDLAREKKINMVCIPELRRAITLYDLVVFFKLLKLMMKVRPHIVHTHTAKAGALGRLAAVIAGVPVKIHTFHGHVFDGYFNPFKARVFMFIERLLSRFTTKAVVVSEGVRDEIVNKLKIISPEKCVIIKLGLELDRFLENKSEKGALRRRINARRDELLVGIVGRLVPIKNHRMFLDIARNIRAQNPNLKVKFVIIGDGETRNQLTQRVKEMGLNDTVRFTGWVKDLASVYMDLDVVALTSLNEGTPVSLIEAMASGKPVIATDVGGVRDVISDKVSGLLVRSNDVDDFVDKLLSLLVDRELRSRLGSQGRDFAKKTFVKDRLVHDMESLYRDCMEANSKR